MKSENEKNPITISGVEKTYDKLFKHMSILSANDVIIRKDCKFCNHPMRVDAELEYERVNRSFSPVLKFFQKWEEKNPEGFIWKSPHTQDLGPATMNFPNVRLHLLQHYAQVEKKKWLAEYGERVTEMMNYKIDKDKRFEMLSNVFEMKWHEIASNPLLDDHKQIDTLCKIAKSILEIDVVQARLRGEIQSVNIVIEKFTTTWAHAIKNAESPEVRNALVNTLDTFQNMDSTIVPEVE